MAPENNENAERAKIDYVGVSPTVWGPSRRMGDVHEQERSSNLWLVTFTDVMGLMLTFFVLLFSMTEPVKEEWSDVSAVLQAQFGKFQGAVEVRGPQDFINIEKINYNRALNMDYLKALLESEIGENETLKKAVLIPQENSLIISLPEDLLFASGKVDITEEGARALYAFGGILSRIRNKVEVIGHADPTDVSGEGKGGFQSNWALSLMRAANVSAALEKVGYGRDIVIHGYSSGRYEDLRDIKDEEARLSFSRRVDILVMDHDGSKREVFPDSQSLFEDKQP